MCLNTLNLINSVYIDVNYLTSDIRVLLKAYKSNNLLNHVNTIKVTYDGVSRLYTIKDFNHLLESNPRIVNVFSQNSVHTEMLFHQLEKEKSYTLWDISLLRNSLLSEGFSQMLLTTDVSTLTPLRIYESIVSNALYKYKQGEYGDYEIIKLNDSARFMNIVRQFYVVKEVV